MRSTPHPLLRPFAHHRWAPAGKSLQLNCGHPTAPMVRWKRTCWRTHHLYSENSKARWKETPTVPPFGKWVLSPIDLKNEVITSPGIYIKMKTYCWWMATRNLAIEPVEVGSLIPVSTFLLNISQVVMISEASTVGLNHVTNLKMSNILLMYGSEIRRENHLRMYPKTGSK